MTTATLTELEAFHQFLSERLKNGDRNLSVDSSIEAFRAYQRDLQRLREELRPSLQRAARGEGREIDVDDIGRRGRERLAREGITD